MQPTSRITISGILSCTLSFQVMPLSALLGVTEMQAFFIVGGNLCCPVRTVPSFRVSLSALPRLRFFSTTGLMWAYKNHLVRLKPARREWERFTSSQTAGASCCVSVILVGNSEVWTSCEQVRSESPASPLLGILARSEMRKLLPFNFVMEVKTQKNPQAPLTQRSESSAWLFRNSYVMIGAFWWASWPSFVSSDQWNILFLNELW